MKHISFVHMADLHLDAPFSSLADENRAEIRRNELEICLRAVVEDARADNSNLLIICGDFFEDSCIRSSTISNVKNLFSELYRTEIIICPGNHDPLRENSYYNSLEWGSNVHILVDAEQVLYLEKYNTCVYNMGARGNAAKDFTTLKNLTVSRDTFNLLVFHGTVDMPFEEQNYNPISSEELFSLGMDYIALGHIHRYSRSQNGKTVMINPGSPEPLGFDEEGVHGFVKGRLCISDQKEKNLSVDFIPVAKRRYYNVEVNITGCTDDGEVIRKISTNEQVEICSDNLYSVTLKGFIPKEYIPGIKNILNAFENKCFYMKIKNETAVQLNYEIYLEDPGVKGEFVRRILDMLENEACEEERETLLMALQYGLQAIENGRVD